MEAAAPVLAPIVEAAIPKPAPKPGNPHLEQSQQEWIATKPRGKGPPLPPGFGRSNPEAPVVSPIVVPDVAPEVDHRDAVTRLEDDLHNRPEAQRWREQADADGFRGLGDLPAPAVDPWPD